MANFVERFNQFIDYTGLTPYKLAKEIGTSDVIISKIKAGKNKPSFDFLEKIVSKYSIVNINWLITGEGDMIKNKPDESGINGGVIAINEGENDSSGVKSGGQSGGFVTDSVTKPSQYGGKKYKNKPSNPFYVGEAGGLYGGQYSPKVVTVDQQGKDNIIFVPVKAQAGYLIGYGDQEYIENLPSFHMPGLSNATYRMFEVQGVSMAPVLTDKDKVIGQWVPNIGEIRENRVHIVVLKEGVMIKRVLNRVAERGKVYLKSDTLTHRADYPIKEIDASEIFEIWYVRMKVSGDLSEPAEIYNRVADLEISLHNINKVLKAQKLVD